MAEGRAGLIFDLDGTLVDSLADIADAVERVLAERGLPGHPESAYRYFVGDGVAELLRRALPEANGAQLDELSGAFRARYFAHGLDQTRPYPGVLAMLRSLSEARVPISVLSNKPHSLTVETVERLLPEIPFVRVYGQREGVPLKPDPSAALEIASAMGLEPGRLGFVGDTPVDVGTAIAAGMMPVGVTWGFRPREELEAAGAVTLVDQPEELLALV